LALLIFGAKILAQKTWAQNVDDIDTREQRFATYIGLLKNVAQNFPLNQTADLPIIQCSLIIIFQLLFVFLKFILTALTYWLCGLDIFSRF